MKLFGIEVISDDLHWWEKLLIILKVRKANIRFNEMTDEQIKEICITVNKSLEDATVKKVTKEPPASPIDDEPYWDEYFKLKDPPHEE